MIYVNHNTRKKQVELDTCTLHNTNTELVLESIRTSIHIYLNR